MNHHISLHINLINIILPKEVFNFYSHFIVIYIISIINNKQILLNNFVNLSTLSVNESSASSIYEAQVIDDKTHTDKGDIDKADH